MAAVEIADVAPTNHESLAHRNSTSGAPILQARFSLEGWASTHFNRLKIALLISLPVTGVTFVTPCQISLLYLYGVQGGVLY